MQHFPCAPPFSRVHLNHRRGTLADERDDTDDDEKDDDDASISLRFVLLPTVLQLRTAFPGELGGYAFCEILSIGWVFFCPVRFLLSEGW